MIRNSAVAEKPRDASCLSVALTVQHLERSLLLLFIAALDLPIRTIKFRAVDFSVTSRLPVINKIQ